MYRPFEPSVPQGALLQPVPVRLHVTAVLEDPVTVAANCTGADWDAITVAAVGAIDTAMGSELTLMSACALLVASATDVAVSVSVIGEVDVNLAGGV